MFVGKWNCIYRSKLTPNSADKKEDFFSVIPADVDPLPKEIGENFRSLLAPAYG